VTALTKKVNGNGRFKGNGHKGMDLLAKTMFKELKSWAVYMHSFGTFGGMIEFTEFDSYEDYQKWNGRIMADVDFAPLLAAYFDSVVDGSFKMVMVDKLGSWTHE
jgi:hypothetical protein